VKRLGVVVIALLILHPSRILKGKLKKKKRKERKMVKLDRGRRGGVGVWKWKEMIK